MVFFDATLPIRIIAIVVTAVAAAGVIAAGIAVGVIASRGGVESISETKPVSLTQSTISVALDRIVAANENRQYYNLSATVIELRTDLVAQIQKTFNDTFQTLVLTGVSDPPVLDPSSPSLQENSSSNRLGVVFANASVYFNQNYTGKEIGAAFNNFTAAITLIDKQSKPSTAEGTFSPRFSTFTDTSPVASLPNGTISIITFSTNIPNTTVSPITNATTGVFPG